MFQILQILLNRFFLSALSAVLVIAVMIFIFLAPVSSYFDFYSLFSPRAMTVNGKSVLWKNLKEEFELLKTDKNLKNRKEKLEKSINIAITRQLLKQYLATESAKFFSLTAYDEYRQMKQTVEQRLVDTRTGGYFIITFKPRNATESAEVLKKQAQKEITILQSRLKEGGDFKTLLAAANNNPIIEKLNFGLFLPGMYLNNITRKEFPLQIKNLRETFFNLKESEVSDILTLSWNDYDGAQSADIAKEEFAYAVIKIEKAVRKPYQSLDDWLTNEKQQAQIKSFVLVPFYFRWLHR